MGKFTVIPQSTFEEMQLDAGVVLKKFTPATPTAPADEDIICPPLAVSIFPAFLLTPTWGRMWIIAPPTQKN